MAYVDPTDAFEHFREKTLEGIKQQFPIDGRTKRLELEHLEVQDNLHPDDIKTQHDAKVSGQTWAVPVVATLTLKDKTTGDVIDSKKVRIAELPKVTRRYSQIVGGQEYQVDNQWQLKPGAYVRRRQSGELETRFQAAGRSSFDVTFDDATKQFRMDYNKAKLPLYPLLKAMGATDDQLEKAWGKEILEANKSARNAAGAVDQFYKSTRKTPPPDQGAAVSHLIETMKSSKLRPDATEITLGKGFDHVTGDALTLATQKMLKVQAGHPEDDRDSIIFKDLRSVGDYAYDKLNAAASVNKTKMLRKINTSDNVRDIVKFDVFNKPIRETFTKNSAAQFAKQVNPVEMVSAAQQTTIMGPGGIQSEQSIMDEAKYVNPSHMGFLDPIHTPEGGRTGITLRLPMGVRKVGNEPQLPLYNLKTGQTEYVGPKKFLQSKVVLPDQVDWDSHGKPKPISDKVKISDAGNEVEDAKFKDAEYVMKHPSQFFNATSNLIPFLSNTSGGRASMATRHIEQAISLLGREAPLVQVATPSTRKGIATFEEVIGRNAAAHTAPVGGTVKSVSKEAIVVKGSDGKEHTIQLYNNYPLNDAKSVLDSTPLVKAGDKIKEGQIVADTNFSKDGQLALGTNLRVAYIPYKGYNFEDGVVISETAAQKLASVHLHKHNVPVDSDTILGKKSFIAQHHGAYTNTQLERIGDDGVVKIGQKVNPGDPLVLALKKVNMANRTGLAAIRKSFGAHHSDKSMTWEGETAGEVVSIHRKGDEVVVHVKTVEPMQVGDKLAGRYGNKGIVTRIIPDKDMPHLPGGDHVEVALNPSGVPGRMNVGQVLETAASKIALKTGKPYVVQNFDRDDILDKVKADLKKHGISDTEELFDPSTGQKLGPAMVGHQHMLKLHHQVDKKVSVRSGLNLPANEPEKYDLNLQPSGGGHRGGQSMDPLGLYALLAHGARSNIREMQTWKSEGPDTNPNPAKQWQSQHHDVWDSIQHGDPLPTPKPTFAFHKFTSMLKGAGINIEKKGHEFILTPLTDKQILHMTGDRTLKNPGDMLYAKLDPKTGEPKPKPGGLFDEKLTGGHGGHKWARIDLAEPVPNPVFESSIRMLTGLSDKDYTAIVGGEKAIDTSGKLVEVGQGVTGGVAIKQMLEKIDVEHDLAQAKKELSKAPSTKVDQILKKVKRLEMLKQTGMKADEAYILNHLPVLPPVMRPVSVMQDGNFKFADINQLYSSFAQTNTQLKDPVLKQGMTEKDRKGLRSNLYDGVKAIMGVGIPYEDADHKGLIHQIAGVSPKKGYFQSTLISRKQDMSMRSTIVPEPALGLDEVGLPKEHAMKLFAPFVVKELKSMGIANNVVEAQKMVAANSNMAQRALEKVTKDRPVLLKRDPALHKYSVQAFRPRVVAGNAIQIHPLVTGGYNADFDGDTMSVFVPISEEARLEAVKMMPSNNLFSEATGKVMYQPTLEAALGLYKLSRVNEKEKAKSFKDYSDVVEAGRKGKLGPTDPVTVNGQTTTLGRILLSTALPDKMQKKMLEDLSIRIDRDGLDKLLTTVAKDHKEDFGVVANKLKDIGNGASFGVVAVEHSEFVGPNRLDKSNAVYVPVGTHTLALNDFQPDKHTRDKLINEAAKEAKSIEGKSISKPLKEQKLVELWTGVDEKIKDAHLKKHSDNPSNLLLMAQAKVKPSYDQYKQMVLAPMVVQDASGRFIPKPITHSYAEGLTAGEYWMQMSGARRGSVLKVQQVREPGYLSKLLMANTMDMLVTGDDCGTKYGIAMPVSDKDLHDRYLVREFNSKGVNIPAGTLLTPDLVSKMRSVDKNAQIVVRSPLKCEHAKGTCQKCMGLSSTGHNHEIGENVGVIAAQSLGERAVQLTLKEFHTGGVAATGGGKSLVNSFERFDQLTSLPKKLPNSATLAMQSGTVEKIEQDPTGVKVWVNNKAHHISKDAAGAPLWKALGTASAGWQPPKVGMKIERGQSLSDPSRTVVNPHDLYKATGSIETVQNHLTDEIFKLYKKEGIKRQHVETLVKAMSNLTKVRNPGDYEGVLRGEFHPQSRISALNRELVSSGKKPIEHEPVLKGVDMLPLSVQDDWMAKLQHQRLEQTILEAAATHGKSNIHGPHPVPGMAYGAEFGFNKTDAKGRPQFKHLEDVPVSSY